LIILNALMVMSQAQDISSGSLAQFLAVIPIPKVSLQNLLFHK